MHLKNGYSEIRTPLILDGASGSSPGTGITIATICISPKSTSVLRRETHELSAEYDLQDADPSYRDLPLRMAELGVVHRHERSGVLHGLMRVRCFTQDDAHLYCTPEVVKEEIKES
jgi:threonyl-tRNA synthetase